MIIIKFNIILTKIRKNCYYIITLNISCIFVRTEAASRVLLWYTIRLRLGPLVYLIVIQKSCSPWNLAGIKMRWGYTESLSNPIFLWRFFYWYGILCVTYKIVKSHPFFIDVISINLHIGELCYIGHITYQLKEKKSPWYRRILWSSLWKRRKTMYLECDIDISWTQCWDIL